MRKILFAVLIFILGTISTFLYQNNVIDNSDDYFYENELIVSMLDVGQGDAILIQDGYQNILVDTGPRSSLELLERQLANLEIEKIDILILTHSHADHIGNASEIISNYNVDTVYESPKSSGSPLVKKYYSVMKNKKTKLIIPNNGEKILLKNKAHIEFIILTQKKQKDINNSSLIMQVVIGNTKMLFTGDAEKKLEDELVNSVSDKLKSQILKSPHHGSRTSSSPQFLAAVDPRVAVISLQKGNEYNHPHKEVLKRYKDNQVEVYRTDLNGLIKIIMTPNHHEILTTH